MSFFKLHKPLVYKYKPIYYDPKKEAKKEREQSMADGDEKADDTTFRPSIRRGSFRELADKNKNSTHKQNRQSNIRLVIIILILFLIAYFLVR
ncbi:MAG: hypothetical protein Q7J05_00240 [Paludibacter sp.]|nr:hypothetical protein [Paludibacter sp.]